MTTSQPSGAMRAPDVDSEFLDLRDPTLARADEFALSDVRKLAAAPVMEEGVVQAAANDATAVDVGGYTVTYQVPGSVDVASDTDEEATFDLANG